MSSAGRALVPFGHISVPVKCTADAKLYRPVSLRQGDSALTVRSEMLLEGLRP